MLNYHGQVFKLDNFDILLILQAAMHLERNGEVKGDHQFFSKLCQLTQMADTFVIQNLDRMNLHEFTTTVIYYFNHQEICSQKLRQSLVQKLDSSISDFNEYQLHVFSHLVQNLKNAENDSIILGLQAKLRHELEELQREKVLMASEDKLREEIRRRLNEAIEKKKRESVSFKLTGTEAD